jgi:hypothetical protein
VLSGPFFLHIFRDPGDFSILSRNIALQRPLRGNKEFYGKVDFRLKRRCHEILVKDLEMLL